MIKKTINIEKPAYLSLKNQQLVYSLSDKSLPDNEITITIEDIGIILLDNPQITITHALMQALLENNTAIITCSKNHLPAGLFMPLTGNTLQNERFTTQIKASTPLKKQLWQQTIQAKITNQAAVLSKFRNKVFENMQKWAKDVKSGDSTNLEARAAAFYWKNIFTNVAAFTRDRDGDFPNNLLNYGYAILRAIIARSLVASGLLPTFGIHHKNRYNAYCLADDIMEPYRPFVDNLVLEIIENQDNIIELTSEIKQKLLQIANIDVLIDKQKSPLMVAALQTTASLSKCYDGEIRKIIYPEFL